MKTKVKKLSLLAMGVCAVVACAAMFAACGDEDKNGGDDGVDYSTYTYNDYLKISESDWDAKTISYQLHTNEVIQGPMDHNAQYLLNLYNDGTALLYQAGLWEYNQDDAAWVDQTNHIAYAYFGRWQEGSGNITVRLLAKEADSTATVNLDGNWDGVDLDAEPPADFEGDHYDPPIEKLEYVFATSGDNAYKFISTSTQFLPMGCSNKIMGAALRDAEDSGTAAGSISDLSSTPVYSSISAWIDSYSKNSDGSAVTFPTLDGTM